jgi:hypothetical protein
VIKWVVNKLIYKHTPECICGYNMKIIKKNLDLYRVYVVYLEVNNERKISKKENK